MICCSSGAFFQPEVFDADAIVEIGPKLAVDGIEVLVTRRMLGRLVETGERLIQSPVAYPVVHAPKRAGAALPDRDAVEQLRETAGFANSIGARVVVLHLWDLPDSDANFDGPLDAAMLGADIFEEFGLTLAVETIPCTQATPLRRVRSVVERDDRIRVTFDTEFLAHHGELDEAMTQEWIGPDGPVRHIHLKDYTRGLRDESGERRYLRLGEGEIDFESLFSTLQICGYNGTVSLEAPALLGDGTADVNALKATLARMSRDPWTFNPS